MSVLVLVAPGSEEIETVAIVDTLVRARIEVLLASCCPAGLRQIRASRGVQLVADCHIDELSSRDFEAIVVPGGLPGSETIRDTPLAIDLLREQAALGRWRAAICAAPVVVLQHHHLLGDASVTCHPAFQASLPAAQLSTARVVRDDAHRLITSQGPGTAIEFALEIVRVLRGDEAALAVAGPMVMP
ncbi:DJ-1 family glyoxalase III [Aeromonas sp. sif2416]|uniref:DJ-1 family glyoxalase III n=1 Tax=Aeromonas sp. sif2416 TaxID=2854793 RepID=UPI001C461E19|nr:DJ-1 family glyoxalase III [Aeromonas sp. sif2416]MBV7435647.1 DJ-1/PfpI family protein [Aeromonas sp. sif2416]